jgi:hypothetical protein
LPPKSAENAGFKYPGATFPKTLQNIYFPKFFESQIRPKSFFVLKISQANQVIIPFD